MNIFFVSNIKFLEKAFTFIFDIIFYKLAIISKSLKYPFQKPRK